MIFYTSSEVKKKQFLEVFEGKEYQICSEVKLAEKQDIEDYLMMCKYKFNSVMKSKYWDDKIVHVIEDTIVEILNDNEHYGRKIGTHIRTEGIEQVIQYLHEKGKIKLISNLLYYKDHCFILLQSEQEGYFINNEIKNQNSCLEDYFYLTNNRKLIQIKNNEYPRIKNFNKLYKVINYLVSAD